MFTFQLALMSDSMIELSYTSTSGIEVNIVLFTCQFIAFEEKGTAVMIAKPKYVKVSGLEVAVGVVKLYTSKLIMLK